MRPAVASPAGWQLFSRALIGGVRGVICGQVMAFDVQ
jgi:hypothetical protein